MDSKCLMLFMEIISLYYEKKYEVHKHIDGAKSRDFSVKGLERVFVNCVGVM
jgi:hypothetical protein